MCEYAPSSKIYPMPLSLALAVVDWQG